MFVSNDVLFSRLDRKETIGMGNWGVSLAQESPFPSFEHILLVKTFQNNLRAFKVTATSQGFHL
jgi:hypothetical protein